MKKTFYTELAYLLGVITLALGTAMMEAANFGVSMVVAPAYIVYSKVSEFLPFVTFGMAEYFTQAILLIVLALVIRQFRVSYLFSFATTVFYGIVLDGWMALIGLGGAPSLLIRHGYYWVGLVICSLGVAFLFHTYISQAVYELFVAEVSRKYHFPLAKCKIVYDCVSCCVAIGMSLLLFGWSNGLCGVKWGTIVCAILNGNVIHWISRFMETHFDFRDGLKLRPFFEK